jgi:hypothetical protein
MDSGAAGRSKGEAWFSALNVVKQNDAPLAFLQRAAFV